MKRALVIICAFAVVGCAAITEPMGMEDPFAIPQPFQGVGRNDSMLGQAIEAPALVVEAPAGMVPEAGTALRDQVVESLRGRDVPALAAPAPRAWVLRAQASTIAGTTKGVQDVHVVAWTLIDANGEQRARIPVMFVGSAENLGTAAIRRFAEETAAAVEAVLMRPGVQIAGEKTKTAAHAAWVGSIKGAPGDGNEALARALQGVLPLKGVRVGAKQDNAAWRIEGRIKVSRKSSNEDVVTLTWRVLDAQGKEAGTIAQENVVPSGRLQKPWAEIAGFAAEAAAEGIAQLLQQIAQAKGA